MNITVEIKAPELANAILSLANALGGSNILNGAAIEVEKDTQPVQQNVVPMQPQQQATVQTQPQVQQQPIQTAVPTTAPVQQPQQQAPVQQQQPQAVPTSAPTYDMNQLAVAATQLMDAGKQPQLLELLATFGAQSLMQLPQEQYGAFATKLRELGANI